MTSSVTSDQTHGNGNVVTMPCAELTVTPSIHIQGANSINEMAIRNQIYSDSDSFWVFENGTGMSVEKVREEGGVWSRSHSLATETHPQRPPASVGGSLDASSSSPTLISLTHTLSVVTTTLET